MRWPDRHKPLPTQPSFAFDDDLRIGALGAHGLKARHISPAYQAYLSTTDDAHAMQPVRGIFFRGIQRQGKGRDSGPRLAKPPSSHTRFALPAWPVNPTKAQSTALRAGPGGQQIVQRLAGQGPA